MRIRVPVKIVAQAASPRRFLPEYQSEGASGFDLCADLVRALELGPGNTHTIPTGVAMEIPEGFEIQVRPRSGLASKHQVEAVFGTIDQDYRGEIKVMLVNRGKTSYVIEPGARIAQGVLVPVAKASFHVVDELTKTERGKNGHGSTGY